MIVSGRFSGTAKVGGVTLTDSTGTGAFVVKYSPAGNVIWAKQFTGDGLRIGTAVAVDGTDNVFVTVRFNAITDFGTGLVSVNGFGYDIALVKLSGTTGTTVWARGFGSTAY